MAVIKINTAVVLSRFITGSGSLFRAMFHETFGYDYCGAIVRTPNGHGTRTRVYDVNGLLNFQNVVAGPGELVTFSLGEVTKMSFPA